MWLTPLEELLELQLVLLLVLLWGGWVGFWSCLGEPREGLGSLWGYPGGPLGVPRLAL